MDKKEQKEKIIGLAKLIAEASDLYAQCLINPEDFTAKIQKILVLETEGDKIQHQLDDHFANEKNIPYLALDRANLVRRLDDVLDQLAIAGRTFEALHSGISSKFYEHITPIAEHCSSLGNCLAEAVEAIYTSFAKALEVSKRIEEVRDQASSTAFELETQIFNDADPQNGWKEYVAATRVIRQTMKIIGYIKEASELLQIMSFKYD